MKRILLSALVLSLMSLLGSCDVVGPEITYVEPVVKKYWILPPASHNPQLQPTVPNAYALAYLWIKDYGRGLQYSIEIYTQSLVGGGGGLHYPVHWVNSLSPPTNFDGYVDLYDGRHFFTYDTSAFLKIKWTGYSREGYYFD